MQFTWADIFWRRGQFHLVQPFAQVTAQTDFKLQDPVFGVGLFPVNISFDLNDRLSIIGQFGVVGTYDLANKRVEAGAQPAIFGSWSFYYRFRSFLGGDRWTLEVFDRARMVWIKNWFGVARYVRLLPGRHFLRLRRAWSKIRER